MASILVIDDERAIRNTLKEVLEYEKHEVDMAEDGHVGLQMLNDKNYDIVLCDIKMPGIDGMEVLDQIKNSLIDAQVIMITGHGSVDTAVEAIKKGAYDFIEKPLDLNRLMITLRNAMDKTNLITETRALKKRVSQKYRMVVESSTMNDVREMINRVAPTDARVLIEVNCAAIPSELIESELFGHEKGSFTSAHKQRKGKFEQANGGTLFLDEIGDMSLSAQAKVLRALQENKITRVGGDKDISVDVRIIAATNKNMKEEIDNKKFREDLYHRISVILIKVPSLNDRKDDIPELADHFVREICIEMGLQGKTINTDAIDELKKVNWTGNIREFRNVMERLIILCSNEITGEDVKLYAAPISGN